VDGHPLLVAHHLLVKPKGVADPHQTHQQQHVIGHQAGAGNVKVSPVIKLLIGVAGVNFQVVDGINNLYEEAERDQRHDNVADDPGDLPDFVVLGQSLVISAKHLSHLKIPVGKQKVSKLVSPPT